MYIRTFCVGFQYRIWIVLCLFNSISSFIFFSTNKEPVFKSSYFFSSDPIADFDFFLF